MSICAKNAAHYCLNLMFIVAFMFNLLIYIKKQQVYAVSEPYILYNACYFSLKMHSLIIVFFISLAFLSPSGLGLHINTYRNKYMNLV